MPQLEQRTYKRVHREYNGELQTTPIKSVLRLQCSGAHEFSSDEKHCMQSAHVHTRAHAHTRHTRVNIFSKLQLHKRRDWVAKGKQPVRNHDIWKKCASYCRVGQHHCQGRMCMDTTSLCIMMLLMHWQGLGQQSPGYIKRLGPGGRQMRARVRRQKYTRTRGVKRQATVQVSEDD